MKRGILLMAFGHPYYGRMAYNLAVTLKAAEAEMPIAVITDDDALKHLDEEKLKIFDQVISVAGGETGIKKANETRMSLNKLSPFDETLSMDVDMLWMGGKPSEVFAALQGCDYATVNEGYIDLSSGTDTTSGIYTFWGDLEEIIAAYDLKGKIYQTRCEFILFRKSATTNKIFGTARKIRRSPKIDVIKLGGAVTDEFALNISLCLNGIELQQSPWQPAYWPNIHQGYVPELRIINKQYNAISFGGNVVSPKLKTLHDHIVQAACTKLGLKHFYKIQSKRIFLNDRITM